MVTNLTLPSSLIFSTGRGIREQVPWRTSQKYAVLYDVQYHCYTHFQIGGHNVYHFNVQITSASVQCCNGSSFCKIDHWIQWSNSISQKEVPICITIDISFPEAFLSKIIIPKACTAFQTDNYTYRLKNLLENRVKRSECRVIFVLTIVNKFLGISRLHNLSKIFCHFKALVTNRNKKAVFWY